MPRPRPRFILNNIPAFRQVCAAVDFSYSALRHALGPRDVRNLYRARATKDRKTSLVTSCSWKQTVVLLVWKKKFLLLSGYSSPELHQSFFTGKKIFLCSFFFCEIIGRWLKNAEGIYTYLITDKQQLLEILASDRFSAVGNGKMTLVELLSRWILEIFKSSATDCRLLVVQ